MTPQRVVLLAAAAIVATVLTGYGCSRGQTPSNLLKPLTIDLGGGITMDFMLIPAGSFTMGSANPSKKDQGPAHTVWLTKAFYISQTEVTQEQWQRLMGSNLSFFKGAKNPVDNVSWWDCQAFLTQLAQKAGGGRSFSLPSEAQWEYACRAGSTSKFSHGDDGGQLGDYGWFAGNSQGKSHPVAQKKPNAWGLYDMEGNVWEWCNDWYGAYSNQEVSDPTGPASGTERVLRGGSWNGGPPFDGSAARHRAVPGGRFSAVGLRVVMTLETAHAP